MSDAAYVLLLVLSVFVSALSQVLLKKSALEAHASVLREYLNAKVVCAYALFFAAVLMDLFALRRVPVSFVPVIETSSYAFLMILGRVVFREKISRRQAEGMAVVTAGILLYII